MSFWGWLRENFFPQPTLEKPSPKIRITPEQADLLIKAIKLIPGYENCFVAGIAQTNSMEPYLDEGMYMVLEKREYTDLIAGDVIWYERLGYSAIHRIVNISEDEVGWHCETKGDNNVRADGIKVRSQDIKGVLRIILN